MVIHYHYKCRSEGGRGHTSVLLLLPASLPFSTNNNEAATDQSQASAG